MEKHIELAKKLKALAEKGVGGEAKNAQQMLDKMLKKHNLTLSDIDGDSTNDYYFMATGVNARLFHQIVKCVNHNLKVYIFPKSKASIYGIKANMVITCTAYEFVEIDQMFSVFSRLFKEESEIFYTAFLAANDLLVNPPDSERKSVSDLSPEELEKWRRSQEMSSKIKRESIRKQLVQK